MRQRDSIRLRFLPPTAKDLMFSVVTLMTVFLSKANIVSGGWRADHARNGVGDLFDNRAIAY